MTWPVAIVLGLLILIGLPLAVVVGLVLLILFIEVGDEKKGAP